MTITPWEITAEFNKQIAADNRNRADIEARYGINANNIAARRQAADVLFGRQLQRDQNAYERILSRDEASRANTHAENYLREVVYPSMKKGRAGRRKYADGVTGPAAGVPDTTETGSVEQNDYGAGGSARSNAIAGIESGGNYRAVGPSTNGHRPYGKHQIMDFNIGPWTREALGRAYTPEEFLNDPAAQEATFEHVFGKYEQQYGPEGAAQAWLGGPGSVGKGGRRDVLGTSVHEYGRRFMSNLGSDATSSNTPPQSQQRRYVDTPSGVPSTDELVNQYLSGEDDSGDGVYLDPTERMTAWTPDDFAREGMTNFEYAGIPSNKEVVGTAWFSGAQVQSLPDEVKANLFAVGGFDPNDTSQYLIMQDKLEAPTDEYGNPIEPTPEAVSAPELPDAALGSAVQPTGQPMSAAGTMAPAPQVRRIQTQPTQAAPVSTAPVNTRTRRNPETGDLEFNVDGQWRPSGG